MGDLTKFIENLQFSAVNKISLNKVKDSSGNIAKGFKKLIEKKDKLKILNISGFKLYFYLFIKYEFRFKYMFWITRIK